MKVRILPLLAVVMALVIVGGGVSMAKVVRSDPGNSNIRGTLARDSLNGGPGDDLVIGRAGNDRITGGPGFDYVIGNEGNDRIFGGPDNDDVRGAFGDDTIYGGDAQDFLFPGPGQDTVSGGEGDDYVDSEDGAVDSVSCGPGLDDEVSADPTDQVSADCEDVL